MIRAALNMSCMPCVPPMGYNGNIRVAIIGGAAAGITMLYEFGKHAQAYGGVRFVVMDKYAGQWGGAAHSAHCTSLRINMRPELHDLEGFIPFLQMCQLQGWDSTELPVRWLLGNYMGMAFVSARSRLELNGAQVQLVKNEVMAIHRVGRRYVVATNDGLKRRFDFVILATGNNPPVVADHLFVENKNVQ